MACRSMPQAMVLSPATLRCPWRPSPTGWCKEKMVGHKQIFCCLQPRQKLARMSPDGLRASYAALYQHEHTPWCGLTEAYCMAMCGIRPPFGTADTDRWMWALAWADDAEFGVRLSAPRLGCIVVMERESGGHVTTFESTDGDHYRCRGGNQSDMVNVS